MPSPAGILDDNLRLAGERVRRAKSVVIFTGAGVSAESGIPTYRSGAEGLWSRQNLERYANPAGYSANLPESYDWYRARARGVTAVEPNAAHFAIAKMAALIPQLTVVTQNIDSLHQRAGSSGVIELHGSLREFRCDACERPMSWDSLPQRPVCDACGGMLRPGVVMFQENLPERALETARDAAARADVLVSIGTSNQVWPAAELPLIALSHGGTVVIVNPDLSDQPFHRNVIGLPAAAAFALPRIVELMSS